MRSVGVSLLAAVHHARGLRVGDRKYYKNRESVNMMESSLVQADHGKDLNAKESSANPIPAAATAQVLNFFIFA